MIGLGKITPVVKNLIIINVGIYVAMVLLPNPIGNLIWRWFFLYFPGSEEFFPTQVITHMFVHFPSRPNSIWSSHLLFNMISLWVFGAMVEMVWGGKRFIQYYFACGLGAAALHLAMVYLNYYNIISIPNMTTNMIMGGASGAIYGVLVAAAYLFPDNYVAIWGVIPIKIKYLAIILIGIGVVMGFGGLGPRVAHFAHLGGALVGFLWLNIGKLQRRRRF